MGVERRLNVTLIAHTTFDGLMWASDLESSDTHPWVSESDGGDDLVEFAGRACYRSWHRPNPATASNAGYVAHIVRVGHLSVLEHASATFYITGVSRALTHELVRHRHLSFSQESQRYVPYDGDYVVPPEMHDRYADTHLMGGQVIGQIVDDATNEYEGIQRVLGSRARKVRLGAARAALPNAAATRIVVTGNYRAWRHFIAARATEAADAEIRELAVHVLRRLREVAPNSFGDFEIRPGPPETAHSPYAHAEVMGS